MSELEAGLTLDVVVQRFADSERALREVRARLASLADSAESANGSAASLENAAAHVSSFTASASSAASELGSVVEQARELLEQSAGLLDGKAINVLQERVAENAVTAAANQRETDERLARIEARLNRLDVLEETASQLSTELARVYRVLPPSWKRRRGSDLS